MANSVFILAGGFTLSGSAITLPVSALTWPLGTTLTESVLGTLSMGGTGTTTMSVSQISANKFVGAGSRLLTGVGAALMNFTNAAENTGVGLDFSTDAILLVRTRAQTAYATLDALGYKVGGTAGVATFGPSAVASITITGGIVTAIS